MTAFAEVIGDPIEHSRSPSIHRFWLDAIGSDADYRATRVGRDELAEFLGRRRGDPDWRGCNVTMPLKLDALALADEATDRALAAGASNILLPRDGKLLAGNTDVAGILAVLPDTVMSSSSEVCVIGTGGAARAALTAMRIRGVRIALISARDERGGWSLMEQFGFGGTVRPLEDAHNYQTADVIINATPLGMTGHPRVPQPILDHLRDPAPGATLLDLVTSPPRTELLAAAEAAGMNTIDGLTMLVEQAAASFGHFFGEPPPRDKDAELMISLRA